MSTDRPSNFPPPDAGAAPYVGLRPYTEADSSFFFGRRRDAALLRNKILAVPLTVLVAPSGVGKTSILRALVIPALRDLKVHVLYFDQWVAAPVASLRGQLAASLGVPATGDEERTLLDLVRLANEQHRSVALIVDQLEQGFIRHAGAMDAFGAEIGALLRSDANVHVVFSIREEYLAGLESLRAHLLTVNQATHRLGRLTGDAAREAIQEPVRTKPFAGAVEPALAETLLEDLKASGEGAGVVETTAGTAGIDLPFLQIVCTHLWKAAGPSEDRQLTSALYEKLGRRKGIVDRYVQEVMAKLTAEQRLDAARTLDLLAPIAGVKMAYPVEALEKQVDIGHERLDAVLSHLGDEMKILRKRDNGKVVELYHDAFTQVLRPWVDREIHAAELAEELAEQAEEQKAREKAEKQERRRGRRRILLIGAFLTLSLLSSIAVIYILVQRQRQAIEAERAAQTTLKESLQAKKCTEVLPVLRELIVRADSRSAESEGPFSRSRDEILGDVFKTLQENGDGAAACFGQRIQPRKLGELAAEVDSPLRIRYRLPESGDGSGGNSAAATLDAGIIQSVWQRLSQKLWDDKRLPLPTSIAVSNDDQLPRGTFVLELNRKTVLQRKIGADPRTRAVLGLGAPAQLNDEAKRFARWVTLDRRTSASFGDGLFFGTSPAWSAPFWRLVEERTLAHASAGAEAFTLEILPAREATITLDVLESVAREPSLYITDTLVQGVLALKQETGGAPCLVHAALSRHRGPADKDWAPALQRLVRRSREALIEAAREGYPAGALGLVLDRMLDDPTVRTQAIGPWLAKDRGRSIPPSPIVLSGAPDGESWGCAKIEMKIPDAQRALAKPVHDEESSLRVWLGSPLGAEMTSNDWIRPEVVDEMYRLRDRLHRQYGVWPPGIAVMHERWLDARYRIGIPGIKPTDEKLAIGAVGWKDALSELGTEIEQRRAALITVDSVVADVKELPPGLRGWLQSRFTPNDLKLLLRGTLVRDGEEKAEKENTIDQLPWLLGALPFWTEVCDAEGPKASGDCLVARLRETQRARLERKGPAGPAPAPLLRGIEALGKDDLEAAKKAFVDALRGDPAAVRQAFLAAYGDRSTSALTVEKVKRSCAVVPPGTYPGWAHIDRHRRSEIEDALASPEVQASSALVRHLKTCALMRSLPTAQPEMDAHRVLTFLRESGEAWKTWPADELYWLGHTLMSATSRSRAAVPEGRELARQLLVAAFASWNEAKAQGLSDKAFNDLLDECRRGRCMWDLFDVADKAALSTAALQRFAWFLLSQPENDNKARLHRIQGLVERARGQLSESPAATRADLERGLELLVYELESSLVRHGEGDKDALLAKLLAARARAEERKDQAMLQDLQSWIVDLLSTTGRLEEARQEIEMAKKSWPRAPSTAYADFSLTLLEGRVREAAGIADELLERSYGTDRRALFESATAHLLAGGADFDRSARRLLIDVDYRFRDYVRLMLWWRLVQRGEDAEAKRLLDDRLLEIPADETPAQRFADGQLEPWRELLVRHYLSTYHHEGAPVAQEIFDPLKDEAAFRASPFLSGGQSFSGFRCEAWFYDGLLQSVTGDEATRKQRCEDGMKQVKAEKCFGTYEYGMSQYMIDTGCAPPAPATNAPVPSH